jgi:hypothetical protein
MLVTFQSQFGRRWKASFYYQNQKGRKAMVTGTNQAVPYPACKNVPIWFMFFLYLLLFWCRVRSVTILTQKLSQPVAQV